MNNITVIEKEGQRVLTTQQLAKSYGTDTQVITNNFNRNKERYQKGKHYICLEGEEKKDFLNLNQFELGLSKNAKYLYLWTERGTLLHAKSLNTDKAWEVYDYLVENYFKPKKDAIPQGKQLLALAILEANKVIEEQDQKIKELEPKASYTDNVLMNDSLIYVTQIAKDYGFSAKIFNKILSDLGIQYKVGN